MNILVLVQHKPKRKINFKNQEEERKKNYIKTSFSLQNEN